MKCSCIGSCSCCANILLLIGRIFLSVIFVVSGFSKILTFNATAALMASKGVPYSSILILIAILFELGGGLLVLLGWYARFGALLLFLFMIPVTYFFHSFWTYLGNEAAVNMLMFYKNLAMMGGMLYVIVCGPGRFSLDGCLRKKGCGCGKACACCAKTQPVVTDTDQKSGPVV